LNEGIGAGITIFAGRFGSGKTEVALNYALALAQDRSVPEEVLPAGAQEQIDVHRRRASNEIVLVDLDIVTPYFRSREMAKSMVERGKSHLTALVGQHLDTRPLHPGSWG
jgi:Mrp family chromosome partitioning ATPase